MINIEQFDNLAKNILEKNIYYHSLALSACMGGIYDYLSENNLFDSSELKKEDWILAGLIHDIDYQGEYKEVHPTKTAQVLLENNLSVDQKIIDLVASHAPKISGVEPVTKAQWSIFCADSLTGLITAVAFVYPDRKLSSVKTSSVLKRFLKEPKFAAGTRRDEVKMCELENGLNISLEKFIEICLTSMQSISLKIEL